MTLIQTNFECTNSFLSDYVTERNDTNKATTKMEVDNSRTLLKPNGNEQMKDLTEK